MYQKRKDYQLAIIEYQLKIISSKVKFIQGSHEVFMRIGGVSTKHRRSAHKEYRSALIKNGYQKFLVNLSYFFFKFT